MDIYKNISNRADTIKAEGTSSWIVDKVELGNGIKMYVEGADFPVKSMPTPEAIWSANVVKKTIVEVVKVMCSWQFLPIIWLVLLPKRSLISKMVLSFNRLSMGAMKPYILKDEFLNPFPREVRGFIKRFLSELGISEQEADDTAVIIAHVLEYDSAYRYRIEDVMSETTKRELLEHPIGEMIKLVDILNTRDSNIYVKANSKKMMIVAFLALMSPWIRNAFQIALENCDFENFQLDEGDRYWCSMRGDYEFFGKSYAERMDLIKEKGYNMPINYPISQ